MAQNKFIKGSKADMQRADHQRFFKNDSDGFSAARNKHIVEESIKQYEAMRAKKAREFDDDYAERADAVVTYLKSLNRGGSNSNILHYFGKKNLAYLRGLEIRQKLMAGMKVIDEDGNVIKKGF